MSRLFMIVAIIYVMTSVAFSAEELLLTEVKKVRLLGIKDGRATVQGLGNSTAEVEVGDSVGRERGKVVESGNRKSKDQDTDGIQGGAIGRRLVKTQLI
jgi:hypothetical protein